MEDFSGIIVLVTDEKTKGGIGEGMCHAVEEAEEVGEMGGSISKWAENEKVELV